MLHNTLTTASSAALLQVSSKSKAGHIYITEHGRNDSTFYNMHIKTAITNIKIHIVNSNCM